MNTNPAERRRMQTSFESLTEVQKVLVSWFILVNLVHVCPFSAILVHFGPFWSISFLFSMCGRLRGILITDTSCGGVLNKIKKKIRWFENSHFTYDSSFYISQVFLRSPSFMCTIHYCANITMKSPVV